MRWLRIAWKTPAVVAVTLGMAAVPLTARLLLPGRRDAVARIGARATSLWGRLLCAVLRVERDVSGTVPTGGVFLVVANHVSYLDIFVLGSIVPSLFVAKNEIGTWPLFGWIARAAGTLFVDRDSARDVVRAGRQMADHLALGVPLALFPEGSASNGTGVRPFLPSLLEPAAKGRVPCWAASISYETPGSELPPALTICWHDHSSFVTHLRRLMGLRRVVARVRFAPEPVTSSDRKELARVLREHVAATFVPIRQDAPGRSPA